MNNIGISDKLFSDAKKYAKIYHRTVPKQIEYWSTIGKIAEANPDLTYETIKDILFAVEEKKEGLVEDYEFSN